ncbi:MAG: hypothetical protein QM765_36520 [Myxococcales bacterium]
MDSSRWSRWLDALERQPAPDPDERERFLEALAHRWATGPAIERWSTCSASLLRRLSRAALEAGPGVAMTLYESLGAFEDASRLLDQMLDRFGHTELRAHLNSDPEEDFLAVRRRWLAAATEPVVERPARSGRVPRSSAK